jgi:hypothetical protein
LTTNYGFVILIYQVLWSSCGTPYFMRLLPHATVITVTVEYGATAT